MPKPSNYVLKAQAAQREREKHLVAFAIKQANKIWAIALHDTFGFGAGRLERALNAVDKAYGEYRDSLDTDGEYGDAVLDRAVAKIIGRDR